MSRVLKVGENQITCTYEQHCANVFAGTAWAKGVDVVKYKAQIDKIVAHSSGKVIKVVDYLGGTNGVLDKENMGYGNYVMLLHDGNYVTLYAHMESVSVCENQIINQGDEIGLMGNTGNSFGTHLHFELRKYKSKPSVNLHDLSLYEWLNPTEYLDAELPGQSLAPVTFQTASVPASGKEYTLKAPKAGEKVELADTLVYSSESGSSIGTRSGVYYVWSDETKNNRIRMTNNASRVGVSGQVSCWIDVAAIGASCDRKTTENAAVSDELSETVSGAGGALSVIRAGKKFELRNTPVYGSETGNSIGMRTGTYYVWSDEVKNNRIRMTNSASRAGVSGQVSFWVDVSALDKA